MKRIALVLLALAALPAAAAAQVRVHPTGVNVNAQAATTVFLTFGGVAGMVPAEAFWCGRIVSAAPDVGTRCDPATLFGRLPGRFDQSRASGTGALTDIMSIPPSVARRAYQAAERGDGGSFFYVRRFVSTTGGPDQYVAVTCRLTGGGARTPFSLTDVRLAHEAGTAVLHLRAGEVPAPVHAEILFNGTGTLRGRWEVVLPGDEPPTATDLLTEATLPLEQRGTQRRYLVVERFNHFLPPVGRFTLPGPDPARLPTGVEGMYTLLLRVEATADKEGDSNLAAVGAGTTTVHSGGVAGFPMPTLRYLVQAPAAGAAPAGASRDGPAPLVATGDVDAGDAIRWAPDPRAHFYRLEIAGEEPEPVLTALLPHTAQRYLPPPWLAERVPGGRFRWRAVALDAGGREIARGAWQEGRVGDAG